jgi:hypothetical protein
MGLAKLNIWVRDETCKVLNLEVEGFDWVDVKSCQGELIKRVYLPLGEAHVEIEVPPGCYILGGNICEMPKFNETIDQTMVIVGCGQELCVNLIVPVVSTCVRRDLAVFIRAARLAGVSVQDLQIATRVMLTAGDISPGEMTEVIGGTVATLHDAKGSTELLKEHKVTLDMIKGLKKAR